ncbi:hypothetical protein GQ457_16G010800 [Hibiscus cannabinus]
MTPASPDTGGPTTVFPSAFTGRWSFVLSRSVTESSVEEPFSIWWSSGLQVLHGLTSGDSELVKAEDFDQGLGNAKIKGRVWSPSGLSPHISSFFPAFQPRLLPTPYHSCMLRPPLKPPYLAGYCSFACNMISFAPVITRPRGVWLMVSDYAIAPQIKVSSSGVRTT